MLYLPRNLLAYELEGLNLRYVEEFIAAKKDYDDKLARLSRDHMERWAKALQDDLDRHTFNMFEHALNDIQDK